jgi:hypothetical protein
LRIRFFDMVHLLVFQETIETTQIGRFDGHIRRRRNLCIQACLGDHGVGRERLILSQQTPQRVIHRRFAVTGGVLQDLQVGAAGDLGGMLVPQPVIGHPKAAVGEQVLAITVVFKRARLTHQLIDDVPIVDRVLVAPHQPRQRIDVNARVPEFHPVGMQPSFGLLADQTAVDRVGVAMNVDQAALVHTHRKPQTTLLPLRRKRPQRRQLLGVPFAPGHIARGDHFLEESQVLLAAAEVPAATQMQRLVHGGLEVPVRRLRVAILMRLADVDPLARQAIMFQEPSIAGLKFALGREVVDRRAQAVATMSSRHSPELPQRVL